MLVRLKDFRDRHSMIQQEPFTISDAFALNFLTRPSRKPQNSPQRTLNSEPFKIALNAPLKVQLEGGPY